MRPIKRLLEIDAKLNPEAYQVVSELADKEYLDAVNTLAKTIAVLVHYETKKVKHGND